MARSAIGDWALDAFAVDLRALAAFRVGLGAMLVYDLAVRARSLTAHYTDAGVMPRAALTPGYPTVVLSLHSLGGSWAWEALLFALAAAAALALAAGWRSRAAAAASFVLLVSLHNRNPLILNGGDALLALLLFWSIFTPTGEVWSLDAARRPRAPQAARLGASLATAALVLQPVILYLATALIKSRASSWRDGSQLGLDLTDWFWATRTGLRLAAAAPGLLKHLCRGALALEFTAPLLLLVAPGRKAAPRLIAMAGMTLLQVSIALCLYVGEFPFVATLALVPLLRLPGGGPLPERWEQGPFALPSPRLASAALVWLVLTSHVLEQAEKLTARTLRPLPAAMFQHALALGVQWSMFSGPPAYTGWFVLQAELEDGSMVDLLTDKPVSWVPPEVPAARFADCRWSKLLQTGLTNPAFFFPRILRYELERRRERVPGVAIKRARMTLVWRRTPPRPGEPPLKLWTLASAP